MLSSAPHRGMLWNAQALWLLLLLLLVLVLLLAVAVLLVQLLLPQPGQSHRRTYWPQPRHAGEARFSHASF